MFSFCKTNHNNYNIYDLPTILILQAYFLMSSIGENKVHLSGEIKNKETDDHIRVECTDWSKYIEDKHNRGDNFNVSAVTKEINSWFLSGYK